MVLLSLTIGTFLGLIHGLLFVAQQKRALFYASPISMKKDMIAMSLFFSCIRLAFFSVSFFYILHYGSINLILVLISFMVTAWFYIVRKGMHPHGRC